MAARHPDGDSVFATAMLSMIRGAPRDGGAALAALCDWLEEKANAGEKFIAVVDQSIFGGFLTAFYNPKSEADCVWHVAILADNNDGDGGHVFGTFPDFIQPADRGFEQSFTAWMVETVPDLWKERS